MEIEEIEELNKVLVKRFGELDEVSWKRKMEVIPVTSNFATTITNVGNYVVGVATPEAYNDIKDLFRKDPNYFDISGVVYVDPEGNWTVNLRFKPKGK